MKKDKPSLHIISQRTKPQKTKPQNTGLSHKLIDNLIENMQDLDQKLSEHFKSDDQNTDEEK